MELFSILKAGGTFLLLSTLASVVVGYHIHINDNYMLDIVVNNETIEFYIQAINVKGWVGVGINDNGKNMVGGDLFIGGFNNNGGYGGHYYVPNNGTNGVPTKANDTNWTFHITEVNGSTFVNASRPLNISNTQHDTEITDKDTNLLWAYHLTSDNPVVHHGAEQRGAYRLNLITGVPSKDSGADIISVCVGTLLMGLVAAVLKY